MPANSERDGTMVSCISARFEARRSGAPLVDMRHDDPFVRGGGGHGRVRANRYVVRWEGGQFLQHLESGEGHQHGYGQRHRRFDERP
jgi:hypothetical protein